VQNTSVFATETEIRHKQTVLKKLAMFLLKCWKAWRGTGGSHCLDTHTLLQNQNSKFTTEKCMWQHLHTIHHCTLQYISKVSVISPYFGGSSQITQYHEDVL